MQAHSLTRCRMVVRLLVVGYSTCHWCHVMERESFESEEIGQVMNDNYISIKVDREERPDVDRVYMTFVQVRRGFGVLRDCMATDCYTQQTGIVRIISVK